MYYVIETQTREDGIVNSTMTARENLNSAKSLYHDRFSKMSMNEQFLSVALLLVDESLRTIDHDIVQTMHPAPVAEPV